MSRTKPHVEVIELGADELSDFASLSMCNGGGDVTRLSKVMKALGALVPKSKK